MSSYFQGSSMTSQNRHEQKFFDALRDIFVGAEIEGDSGFINLMRIKSRYYQEGVFPQLKHDIDQAVSPFPDFREELFDKLYTFFKRYFSESGSIYFRYTPLHQNIYEKVYTDDRDVVLFWKTHMLYYVKTDRIFTSLSVEVDGVKFFFDAGGMELKKSNEKRQTIYDFCEVRADGTLVFDVTYSERGRTTRVDETLRAVKQAGGKLDDETFTKACRVFEKQSEVDYFINKDARSFLLEQFDLWMYQYLFAGQNVWTAARLAQLQALKTIACKVIDFISQFEDELVKIWNKPKFVRNAHYILTLDKLAGSEVFVRLLAHENFALQVQEWRDLGMLGDDFRPEMLTEKDLTGAPLHPQYAYLPVDTRFIKDLELDVLALFDDLDADLDGWLVHSENYQALNTMTRKFSGLVNSVYADPPYNTSASEIIYENDYKDSSWLSMIENRLLAMKPFLSQNAIACITIDDYEAHRLKAIVDGISNFSIVGTVAIKNSPSGRPTVRGFRVNHEYAVFLTTNTDVVIGTLDKSKDQLALYKESDEKGVYQWMNLRKRGGANTLRVARPKQFYPIYVFNNQIRIPKMNWSKDINDWLILEDPLPDEIVLYPIGDDGKERIWAFGNDTARNHVSDLQVREKNGQVYIFRKVYLENTGSLPSTWWEDPKYFTVEHGNGLLENILGKYQAFPFPKSVHAVFDCLRVAGASQGNSLILDFFGGSGTTAHAVMNLNRADGGKRKYILVEMGEHFHSVILPRVKKVAFSDQWKDGKANGGQGMSHFVKYYDLEQYEDVLRSAHYGDAGLFDNPYEDPCHRYVFLSDLKQLHTLEVDVENNRVTFHPERLYPDIDLAETLSHLRGKWIKRITADWVEFQDGERINLADPDWRHFKKMIWWQ